MKRTIEIDDTLQERVDSAIEDVKQELLSYLDENRDTDKVPCINNDLDYSGAIHEIVDGSVPIYTKEIEDTWYLYASELEEAYENAGCGTNPRENNGMAAIYYYISEKVNEWYSNEAEDIFDEWALTKCLKVGDRVRWEDPDDDACSGDGVITSIKGEVLYVKKEDGGDVEALVDELEKLV